MPKTATRQDGPQAVKPYVYPQGEANGDGYERVSRQVSVTGDIPDPPANHTVAVTNGEAGLPMEDQPKTIGVQIAGTVQRGTKIALYFRRLVGERCPYQGCGLTIDPPPGPGHPPSVAQ